MAGCTFQIAMQPHCPWSWSYLYIMLKCWYCLSTASSKGLPLLSFPLLYNSINSAIYLAASGFQLPCFLQQVLLCFSTAFLNFLCILYLSTSRILSPRSSRKLWENMAIQAFNCFHLVPSLARFQSTRWTHTSSSSSIL